MAWWHKSSILLAGLLLGACADDGDGPSGETDNPGGSGPAAPTCLDDAQQTTPECAVEPEGGLCEAAPNPSCAPVTLVEVSNPAADGPCLRLVIDNNCGETLYSTTCLEYQEADDDEPQWQCWVSTTLAGGDVDVGQCNSTGSWTHWSGFSSGQLDTIDGTCDPEGDA